jgi:hypothetical protein
MMRSWLNAAFPTVVLLSLPNVFAPTPLAGQGVVSVVTGTALADVTVKSWMDRLQGVIAEERSDAIRDLDYAAEQRIAQIDLAMQSFANTLDAHAKKRMRELDNNIYNYIERIEHALRMLSEDVQEELGKFALSGAITLQSFCDGSIFCETTPYLSAVRNAVAIPNQLGEHRVVLEGTIFTDSAAVTAWLGEVKLPPEAIYRGSAGTFIIDVPRQMIRDAGAKMRRASLDISVTRWRSHGRWEGWVRRGTHRKEIERTHSLPFYILPSQPVRVSLTTEYEEPTFVDCDQCIHKAVYQIQRSEMEWSHFVEIADSVAFDRALEWRWDTKASAAGRDYYWVLCRPPAPTVNAQGKRGVSLFCLNAVMRQEGNHIVQEFANRPTQAGRDSVFKANYAPWAWQSANAPRSVAFSFQLKKRKMTYTSERLPMRSTTPRLAQWDTLAFGEHSSIPFPSDRSVTLKVTPLFDGGDNLIFTLREGGRPIKLGTVAEISLESMTVGNRREARVVVSPAR